MIVVACEIANPDKEKDVITTYRRHCSACPMEFVALLLLFTLNADTRAADRNPKVQKSAKTQTKQAPRPDTPTSRMLTSLERVFKVWDIDKDGSVQREELQKFYKSRKIVQKPGAAKNQSPELPEPVLELLQKMDTDSNDRISDTEFGAWASDFAEYMVKLLDLRQRAAAAQQRLAEVRRVMSGGRNITAIEGTGNELARRAIRQCEFDLEQLLTAIKNLESQAGHAKYQALVEFELAQRMR